MTTPDFVGFFQIVNDIHQMIMGGYTAKDASELRTGILVKTNSSKQLDACSAGDTPFGICLTHRTQVYAPTSVYAGAGESVSVVRGPNVQFLADIYSFAAGTLPSLGANLYAANNGLLQTTGTAASYVGQVIDKGNDMNVRNTPTNSTRDLVLCEAKFLV